LDVKLDG